jgi:hypothetical protein
MRVYKLWVCALLIQLLWVVLPQSAQAQQDTTQAEEFGPVGKPKVEFKWAGQIGFATDFRGNYFANAGGPHLNLLWRNWLVGIGMFPSFRFSEEIVTPQLGGGFFLGYRRIIFNVPFYFLRDKSRPTFGFGYRFK